MLTSEELNTAADLIQQRGWTKGSGWYPEPAEETPLCVEGALRAATGYGVIKDGKCRAYEAVKEYLGSTRPELISGLGYVIVWAWNDMPGRTQSEVVATLRAAAVIEYAREQQESAWLTYAGCGAA